MWALTEMIRASHTSTRIGRFDVSDCFPLLGSCWPEWVRSDGLFFLQVDGCYDLNLLSYT